MIYVLAYPEFEQGVAESINRFRTAHEPERAKLVPAHITLVFGLRKAQPQKFLVFCENVARHASELSVKFTASEIVYDPFEKAHKLFLLSSIGSRALTTLHKQLYSGPHRAQLNHDIPYRPHMTVATHEDRTIIEQLDVGTIGSLPISGTISALQVVEHIDNRLNLLRTIQLGS
jgi:2'-5' RNA ligase